MSYVVATPAFSGPLELLLVLVRREQVELYDIPIAKITDAYVAELAAMPQCDLDAATEFLQIAAVLVQMKARRMLPGAPAPDTDEELDAASERDLLLARMVECSAFRAVSEVFRELMNEARRSSPRRPGPLNARRLTMTPPLLAGVTLTDMRDAYLRAVTPVPTPRVDIGHISAISMTVGDAVAELSSRLSAEGRVTFRRLTSGIDSDDRIGLVVRFLAVLELVKQGLAEVDQATTFGDIVISWSGDSDQDLAAAAAAVDIYEG